MFDKLSHLVNAITVSGTKGTVIAIIFHIALLAAIGTCVFLLGIYLDRHNTIQKIIAKIKNDFEEQDRLKTAEYKKRFELEGHTDDEKTDKRRRLEQKLYDSGIKQNVPEITPLSFMITVFLLCVVVAVVGYFVTDSILTAIICGIMAGILVVLYMEAMIAKNYRKIEIEAIKFVNLMRNYSHIEQSVGEMFGRTIPYLEGSLRLSVEQCYYEIKSSGNLVMALENLEGRTSYTKLREFFSALKTCATHNEDYELIIDEASDALKTHVKYRDKITTIKKNNLIDLLVITAAGFLMLFAMRGLLSDIDVFYYMFRTAIGQIIVGAIAIITILGLYQFVKTDVD